MCISADCHEAIFSGQSQVRNRDRELVIEDSCCVRKTDSVLRQVGSSFSRIPLSFHGNKICILYAYVKELRCEGWRNIIPDESNPGISVPLYLKLAHLSNYKLCYCQRTVAVYLRPPKKPGASAARTPRPDRQWYLVPGQSITVGWV